MVEEKRWAIKNPHTNDINVLFYYSGKNALVYRVWEAKELIKDIEKAIEEIERNHRGRRENSQEIHGEGQ